MKILIININLYWRRLRSRYCCSGYSSHSIVLNVLLHNHWSNMFSKLEEEKIINYVYLRSRSIFNCIENIGKKAVSINTPKTAFVPTWPIWSHLKQYVPFNFSVFILRLKSFYWYNQFFLNHENSLNIQFEILYILHTWYVTSEAGEVEE